MAKYELTINADYVPQWDRVSSVREFLQNARDAEIEHGAKMTVEHVYRQRGGRPVGALVICNEGCVIEKEALLMGTTSKSNRADLLGFWGEGLKLACLAGLRNGFDIKMRVGDETWIPKIERSERYNADVLVFNITGGNKFERRVQIEILGIDADEWDRMKRKFLFVHPPVEESVVKVPSGRILVSPEYKGMVFVKGLFVCSDDSLYFGYDANRADIDRDRRMISDRYGLTSRMLGEAIETNRITDKVYEMLHEGSQETGYLYSLGADSIDSLAQKFRDQYGDNAFPVDDEANAVELGHFGKRGVKLPYALRSLLQQKFGSFTDQMRKLRMGTKHIYSLDELQETERANFVWAKRYLEGALEACGMDRSIVDRIVVADFGDPNLCGTFDSTDCSVRLARKELDNRAKALRTLVHEAAHTEGRDGTKQHEAAIGNLTQYLFGFLP